ncbi:hypothetical protein K6025_00845 [Ehrlichia sp. JZT12]
MHVSDASERENYPDRHYYLLGHFSSPITNGEVTIGVKDLVMLHDTFVSCKLDVMFDHYDEENHQVKHVDLLDIDFLMATIGDELLLMDKNYLLSKDQANLEDDAPVMFMNVHNAGPVIDLVKEFMFQKESDSDTKKDSFKYLCLASDDQEGKFLCSGNYSI